MPIAIERPNGRLVDLLLEAGHPVVPVSPNAIAAFCASQGYSGRRPAAELLARLRPAPAGAAGPALTMALGTAVLPLAAVPRALNTAVTDPGRSATAHLGEHPDGEIFTSLPRSGQINAAQMLAEWGDCRQAHDGPDAVAALAGCTPVTKESGKHRAVHFHWACGKRFRRAMTIFAGNSRHASPWGAKIYNDARAAGKDHPHAVRILARAWIRVIWRCWLDGTPYNPARHGAAAAVAEPIAA
jgi:transposase